MKLIQNILYKHLADSKADLIALVRRNLNVSYKTVFNCIDKLIEKSILTYDNTLHSWILVDMENMTKAKMTKVLKLLALTDDSNNEHL